MPTIPVWAIKLALGLGLIAAVLVYGHSRYSAGKDAADAQWVEAGRKAEQRAARAGTMADKKSDVRTRAEFDRVAQEKERIDAAEAAGGSPLDVLFGGNGLR